MPLPWAPAARSASWAPPLAVASVPAREPVSSPATTVEVDAAGVLALSLPGAAAAAAVPIVPAAVPASSAIVATARRARAWVPTPPPGTCGARPRWRRSAIASTTRHTTKCAQASHTTAARTPSTVSVEVGWVSHSIDGALSGHGVPKAAYSRTGTPTTMAAVATSASRPRATWAPRPGSPADRGSRVPSVGRSITVGIDSHLMGFIRGISR